MYKFVEKLTDLYLFDLIKNKTMEIYQRDFEETFEYHTTNLKKENFCLGSCFKEIQHTCEREIWRHLQQRVNKTTITIEGKYYFENPDPLIKIIDAFLEEFLEYVEIKGYVETILNDEWIDKEKELIEKGILNQDGELINA